MGGTYPRPKDSNAAVRVCDRATGNALEGVDIQTNRLSVHYSKILDVHINRQAIKVATNSY